SSPPPHTSPVPPGTRRATAPAPAASARPTSLPPPALSPPPPGVTLPPPPPYDAFVTKLNPTGTALVYSTCLGSNFIPNPAPRIAVDAAGSSYVTGSTCTTLFPTTPGAFQPTFGGGTGSDGADPSAPNLTPTP